MVDEARFLTQRFNNSIIARKGTGYNTNTPVRVSEFSYSSDGSYLKIGYFHLNDNDLTIKKYIPEEYILDCPKVGMIFNGNISYYLSRYPDRQWKCGYNRNIIRIESISGGSLREMGYGKPMVLDPGVLRFVYNPKYISFGEGMDKLFKNVFFNFPFSRKYAISRNIGIKHPVLYYKTWEVGWVEKGTILLPQGAHHLFEEVSQYAPCRRV